MEAEDFIISKGIKQHDKISQEQLYNLLLSRELSWQEIIYDLIASEQLDPWDIDLAKLASRYLEKISQLEEASFFVSSKVLLAASILLRIKSELLLSKYIKSLDDILFGKPALFPAKQEEFVFDEELPELLPRTPLPRLRRVTLNELMEALNRAINTEHRRIRKELDEKQVARQTAFVLPHVRIKIREKIKELYEKIKEFFSKQPEKRLAFSALAGNGREEKIATFVPLLHLNHQSRIILEQENHFDEIYIWLRKIKREKEKNIQ